MLGNQGVTESNIMQYLGIIEQRTSEILNAYAASQHMSRVVEQQVSRFYCHGMCDGMFDGIKRNRSMGTYFPPTIMF